MARGRMLNRSVATDDKIARLIESGGPWAGLFHHRLIAFLDVNGNVRADEFWLKATVFPRDSGVTPAMCRKFAGLLPEMGLALPYEIDGMPYLHFPSFGKNQVGLRPDREHGECPQFEEKYMVGNLPEEIPPTRGKLAGNLPETFPPEDKISLSLREREDNILVNFVDRWNLMASELGYKTVRTKLTAERKTKLAARTKEPEFDFDAIIKAFYEHKPEIPPSNKSPSGWKPDFDYVIRSEQTYIKILEGGFSTKNIPTKQPGGLKDDGKSRW